MEPSVKYSGRWSWELFNPDGSLEARGDFPNGTTLAGINDILGVYLASGTQNLTWYLGLINNTGFSALSPSDTISSHPGWVELTTYAEGVRPTWVPGTPSGQSVTNPTSATFTINAAGTLAGAFLVSNTTKGGTSGMLWATGAFGTPQAVTNGQLFKVTYTCNGTGS
jgi:hypothetical protein